MIDFDPIEDQCNGTKLGPMSNWTNEHGPNYPTNIKQPKITMMEGSEILEIIDQLVNKEAWDLALKSCEHALELYPNWAIFHHKLGVVLFNIGKFNEAIKSYEKSLELDPQLSWNYHYLGEAYRHLAEGEKAISAYQKAVEAKLDCSYTYHHLGELYGQLKQWEKAAEYYEEAIKLNPNFVWSYVNLGDAYRHLAEGEKAISAYQKAVEAKLDCSYTYHHLGELYGQLKEWEKAAEYYEDAIKLNPHFVWPYVNLFEVYCQLEKWAESDLIYQKITELASDIDAVYIRCGDILGKKEKWVESLEMYKKAIEINPSSWAYYSLSNAFHHLGELYGQLKEWEKAGEYYEDAIKLNPHFVWPYVNLFEVYCQLEQWAESDLIYQKITELASDIDAVYIRCGDILGKKEKWVESLEMYRKAIEINPSGGAYYCLSNAFYHLGELHSQLKQWEKAGEYYKEAIKLNPHFVWSYVHLFEVYCQLEQWAGSDLIYQKITELASDIDTVYICCGDILGKKEKWVESLEMYKKAVEINPSSWAYYCLSNALFQIEKWEEGLNYAMQLLHFHPEYHDPYVLIGKYYKHHGMATEALNCIYYWQKIPYSLLTKFYDLNDNLYTTSLTDPNITRTEGYPREYLSLTLPTTIESNLSSTSLTNTNFLLGAGFVTKIPQGRAWSSNLNSAIITSNQQLVKDLSTGASELIILSDQIIPYVELKGNVAFLAARWGNNYYHWMFDVVSRFSLLSLAGISLDEIDYFAFIPEPKRYHLETINYLGIPPNKIIYSSTFNQNEVIHVKADLLIVPSKFTYENEIPYSITRWGCQFLQQKFRHLADNFDYKSDKTYVARGNTKSRQIHNEAEVIAFLESIGFMAVNFELMSVAEQVAVMASAKVVVAPHGAGLTNLVFCQPGTKVIEIFCPTYMPGCYRLVSQICDLSYYYLIGDAVDGQTGKFERDQDLAINIRDLQAILELAVIL